MAKMIRTAFPGAAFQAAAAAGLRDERVFDWLEDVLDLTRPASPALAD